VTTKYKKDCDAFRASELFKKLSDPTSLGVWPQSRHLLENRLMDAFEEGWTSCDSPDNGPASQS
jgi:hypothetical protein